jgi:hypothetical protein
MEIVEKDLTKQLKEKDRVEKEMRLMDERYQELYERSKEEKQAIKKEIMVEVSELVALVKQKDGLIKALNSDKDELGRELEDERQKISTA